MKDHLIVLMSGAQAYGSSYGSVGYEAPDPRDSGRSNLSTTQRYINQIINLDGLQNSLRRLTVG